MKNKLLETYSDKTYSTNREKITSRIELVRIDNKDNNIKNESYRILNFKYEYLFKDYKILIREMKNQFGELLKDMKELKKVLVVGLGNKEIVCDSLGAKVVNKLLLLDDKNEYKTNCVINGIIPNVLGITGIPSFDIIAGVTNQIKPDLVICIDSLSASIYDNLFQSIQISNGSITAGSGVKNLTNKTISQKTLKTPVLILGIPTLISLENIINSLCECENQNFKNNDVWLSPKDVDFAIEEFSYIFSKSLNEFFYPEIQPKDIEIMVKGIF